MIFYDYVCAACAKTFELGLRMAEYARPTTEPCPSCGQLQVRQLVGSPAIGDSVRLGITKPPSEFMTDVLGRIKHSVPGNKIGSGKFKMPGRA
jgi:putative FmdB family regulatory protein